MKKTLGGDRLGAGKKMQVELNNYSRSTHNLDTIWRSTMSAGTLVPFMLELGLPGDTWSITLDANAMTHPTVGPLFGSYKMQLDVFEAPMRLYNAHLHNNTLGIGLNMSQIKFPAFNILSIGNTGIVTPGSENYGIIDNTQINPSCLLAYLGIRGIGYNITNANHVRTFNAIPLLAYWEIYKNYYANKQEEIGAVIHTDVPAVIPSVGVIRIGANVLSDDPAAPNGYPITFGTIMTIEWTSTDPEPLLNTIMIVTNNGVFNAEQFLGVEAVRIPGQIQIVCAPPVNNINAYYWRYMTQFEMNHTTPKVVTFPLSDIDSMRMDILSYQGSTPYNINTTPREPYKWVYGANATPYNYALCTQEGLGLKTYQSDIFNNWLSTEWIDGPNGISQITAIDTTSGSFTMDQLNIAGKVYDMLNRIAVSGGSYDDWIEAVYQANPYTRCESPIYHGGLIKELVFQEVVSNAATQTETYQPLGTLAGRGAMHKKHKGGHVEIKCSEPCYLMGIISLTPRIDYSQGNRWFTTLLTMDDLHKPALDEIGFQELITEQMAWWDTYWDAVAGKWVQKSAGKQPAWINYMTNFNRTYGNFAIPENEMFMTLNRRYELDPLGYSGQGGIKDLTTYIDPAKYNFIFAQTSLDAQNFWVQVAIDMQVRRLMSAKMMPNL